MKPIKDIHLSKDMKVTELSSQLASSGFMAQHFGEAVQILREAEKEDATLFLSFTSNMAASGLRGIFADLAARKKIAAIITSSGSIDEDLIRSSQPYLQGSFEADDEQLAKQGMNRMGNILVPNQGYEWLDDFSAASLEKIYQKKKELATNELLKEIGLLVNSKDSFVHQAAINGIPIFCPGITDGSFGMQLSFFGQKHPDFKVDVLKDFNNLLALAMGAKKSACIILGGGVAKHHTIIANILSGGFDYAVYVNSSSPYHGSLSGATTSEAKSWGKIKPGARSVTIFGDAMFIFPLLVASVDELML